MLAVQVAAARLVVLVLRHGAPAAAAALLRAYRDARVRAPGAAAAGARGAGARPRHGVASFVPGGAGSGGGVPDAEIRIFVYDALLRRPVDALGVAVGLGDIVLRGLVVPSLPVREAGGVRPEGTRPIRAVAREPLLPLLSRGCSKDVAAVGEGLVVQLLDVGRHLAGDLLLAHALGVAGLPGLDGLARVVVADEAQVVEVRARLVARAEAQAAGLLDGDIGDAGEVGLGDVVLGQARGVVALPHGDVEVLLFVVDEALQPYHGEVLHAPLAGEVEFDEDGGAEAVAHGESGFGVVAGAADVPAHDIPFSSALVAFHCGGAAACSHAQLDFPLVGAGERRSEAVR